MISSDPNDSVKLWEAPFFEQPLKSKAHPPLDELEAMAREQGLREGRAEGLAQGRAEAQAIVDSVTSVAAQMSQPFLALDATVTKELAEMAMRLAQQIVRRELTIDSSVVTGIIEDAIETLYKLDGEIVIFVNPADAQSLRDFSPEALEGKTWRIVEDTTMSPGGCQVKTPTSFVDASVERQIDVVFSNLLASWEQGPEPST